MKQILLITTIICLAGFWQAAPSQAQADQEKTKDRIADGKVLEMWHVADTSGMLQQIGVTAAQPKN